MKFPLNEPPKEGDIVEAQNGNLYIVKKVESQISGCSNCDLRATRMCSADVKGFYCKGVGRLNFKLIEPCSLSEQAQVNRKHHLIERTN